MSSRRKNKHPKRAENAKTVVVASVAEEESGRGRGGARGPVLLCLRIPDDEQRNGDTKRQDDDDERREEKERATRVRCLREGV